MAEHKHEHKTYLWENFADDSTDRGIEVSINWKGEELPFRIKRVLTIDERQRANEAGVEIGIDEKGRPVVKRQDQAAFTKEIVLVGLKSWPFEFEPGKPVPINRTTVAKVDAGLLDELANRILGIVQVDKVELDPFVPESDEA